MSSQDLDLWIKSRSVPTQLFVRFGAIAALFSLFVIAFQGLIWISMGWGSANFLPIWVLVPIYAMAAMVALALFYFCLAFAADVEKRLRWISATLMGSATGCFVAIALAHSMPQLSTLVFSSPKTVQLQVHKSTFHVPGLHRRRLDLCRNETKFGPAYLFRGGWCGVYLQSGRRYSFEGHGHGWAVRLQSYER